VINGAIPPIIAKISPVIIALFRCVPNKVLFISIAMAAKTKPLKNRFVMAIVKKGGILSP